MQQHLQRLDGVAKAEVSLRDGQVTVLPKDDAVLDPYLILKATYDSGVSVVVMEIIATGNLEAAGENSGTMQLRINAGQTFEIAPNTAGEDLWRDGIPSPGADSRVAVRGILYRKPTGKATAPKPTEKLKIELLEIKNAR